MAALLTGNPASMDEIRELNQAILGWIPKVRSKLKTSVLQFNDGKTQCKHSVNHVLISKITLLFFQSFSKTFIVL